MKGGEKCEVNREAMSSELAQQKPASRKELQNTDGHEQVRHREERRKDNSLHQVHEKLGSFLRKIRKSDELKIKTKCCFQTKRTDTVKGDVLSEYRSQRSQYQEARTRFSEKIPSGQDEEGNGVYEKRGNEKHDTYLSCTVSELFKPSYREAGDGKENECKVVTKRNERSIKYDEQPYNKKMIVIEAKIKGIDDTLEHVTEETLKNKCGENLGR